jgi:hypothetical protein
MVFKVFMLNSDYMSAYYMEGRNLNKTLKQSNSFQPKMEHIEEHYRVSIVRNCADLKDKITEDDLATFDPADPKPKIQFSTLIQPSYCILIGENLDFVHKIEYHSDSTRYFQEFQCFSPNVVTFRFDYFPKAADEYLVLRSVFRKGESFRVPSKIWNYTSNFSLSN